MDSQYIDNIFSAFDIVNIILDFIPDIRANRDYTIKWVNIRADNDYAII